MATRVKICGVTSLEDAELAVSHGAWAVGLIFAPSPRGCSPDAAAGIGAALRRRAEVCGVFVNAPLDEVVRTAEAAQLTLLQLHGDEGPAYASEAARRTGARIMKSMQVRTLADVQALEAYHVDFHLVDAHSEALRGGTGQTFDWSLVDARRSRLPLVMSGGLTPENVGEAIAATAPYGVDVASGVEAEPGRKDPARLEAFFDAVRTADPEPAVS